MADTFNTTINAQPAPWPAEIRAEWEQQWAMLRERNPDAELDRLSVNYFTPRPYRNEYDRGSMTRGFVATVHGLNNRNFPRDVVQMIVERHPLEYACAVCGFQTAQLAGSSGKLPGHGTGGAQCPGSYQLPGWVNP